MSLPRRLSLIEWARANDSWIVEDDYDSEFRYTGRPFASLQGLNSAGRVIYAGSFNKVMFSVAAARIHRRPAASRRCVHRRPRALDRRRADTRAERDD